MEFNIQTPRSDFHILENLAAQGIIFEEDIPEDIPVPGTDENLDGDRASDDNLDGASNVLGPDDNPDDVLAVPSTSSRGADMIHTDVDLPEVSDDPVSELRNTGIPEVQQKKRGREYLLLKEDVIVASGHEVPGQTNLDGININLEAQAIVAVDEIHEAVGDTVGIKIHSADRTNTDARLLPCKVMEVSVKNGKKFYRIYSASGILKNKFTGEELADMKNVTFPSLSSADPSNLEEVSLVHPGQQPTGRPVKRSMMYVSAKGAVSQIDVVVRREALNVLPSVISIAWHAKTKYELCYYL